MTNLEYLTSINSRDFRYGCLQPWEREDKPLENPLEEQPRVYREEIPDDYFHEPEEEPYDPYEPKRGVAIIPL